MFVKKQVLQKNQFQGEILVLGDKKNSVIILCVYRLC